MLISLISQSRLDHWRVAGKRGRHEMGNQMKSVQQREVTDTGPTMISCFLLSLLWVLTPGAATGQSHPLDSLQAGQWYEVPNSKLSSVYPNPIPPGNPVDIMLAWNGGAFDTKRNNLIIWGGGHGNYGGNEIYTFNINTLTWSRAWGPSSTIPDPVPSACNEVYGDGNPASRHTYSSIEYIPSIDRLFNQGGSLWCQNGSPSGATWLFNFSTGAWTRQVDVPNGPGGTGHLGSLAVYDPVTQHIFNQRLMQFEEFDPVTNTYTTRGNIQSCGSGGNWQDRMSAAIDPERRKFVWVGSGYVRVWDLNTFTCNEYTAAQIAGDGIVVNSDAPGFQYDPTIKKFVAWRGGANVYTFDLTTRTFTLLPPAASNTVTPPTPDNNTSKGTYGKFRYIPSRNAYVMAHMTTQNVYLYRLSSGTGDLTPPAAPTGLTVR